MSVAVPSEAILQFPLSRIAVAKVLYAFKVFQAKKNHCQEHGIDTVRGDGPALAACVVTENSQKSVVYTWRTEE